MRATFANARLVAHLRKLVLVTVGGWPTETLDDVESLTNDVTIVDLCFAAHAPADPERGKSETVRALEIGRAHV